MFSDKKPQKNYFNIVEGKLTIRVPEGTPNALTRVNKIGKTVHEVKHDSFTGKIASITTSVSPYGKNWEIDFKANDESIWTLQLGYSSSFAKALLKKLPNINLDQEMTVSPFSGEIDGKKISTITVYQNGTKIEPFYNKDNPNGLPQMELITVKGVETWDDTKQLQFLEEMVATTMKTTVPSTIEAYEKSMNSDGNIDASSDELAQVEADAILIDEEDLPF
jgi:hypothetical protein